MTGPTAEEWKDFYGDVVVPSLDIAGGEDVLKPGCNDLPIDGSAGTPTIISRFWSTLDVKDFFDFVDPRNWARLGSEYWREMTPVTPLQLTKGGFRGTFREVVALPTGDITAYLEIDYWSDGKHTAACTFREALGMNSDVVFDRGFVVTTNRSVGPVPGATTLVQSNKSIVFRDPLLNELPDLACDNGWVDLMIRMAIPADRQRPAPGPSAPVPKPADEIERWQLASKRLIDRCTTRSQHVVQAVKAGRWDSSLVDAVIAGADDLTDATAQSARAWRAVVGQLAETDTP